MKLERFLDEEFFSKYTIGIEKIKEEFVSLGYERFLWRKTIDEWEAAKKTTQKEREMNSYSVNSYIQEFINQFSDISSDEVVYIFPESYTPNYFMIQELAKQSNREYIIENLLPEDDTINHVVIFDCKKSETIQLMNRLVYSAVLGENFGGYKLLGQHLCYYLEFCADDDLVYTIQPTNELIHFQGYVTRKDTNPFIIYNTRKNIETMIKKGYFNSEYELFKNLKDTLMPYLQRMYMKAIRYGNDLFDWKAAKSKLKGDLIERGIIQSKWKNEQSLYLLVKKTYPEAIFQYRPEWLSPQSLDIYIPELRIGIEYQGIQHYSAVDFFGGEESLKHRQVLDERKQDVCRSNNVFLIEWNYNLDISNTNLKRMINTALKK